MKKHILYGGFLLAMTTLASCNGDYDDWASPQSNAQEDAAAAYGVTVSAGSNANTAMTSSTPDTIKLVALSSANADISGFSLRSVKINGNAITAFLDGNDVEVLSNDLDSITEYVAFKSRASVKRNLSVETKFAAKLSNGDAVALTGNTDASLTPAKTPDIDEKGYCMMGQWQSWNKKAPTEMKKTSDSTYTATVETTVESNWFKFYAASYFKGDATTDEDLADGTFGCRVNGDEATANYLVWANDKYAINCPVIKGIGKFKVTLDAKNMTYTVAEIHPELYMTGSNYGWGKTWNVLTPVNGIDGEYWGIFYLHKDEEFKFAPQNDWGNDFGSSATINDVAGAGLSDNNGNLKVAKAGWYLLDVVNSDQRIVNVYAPNVYLIGNTAGEWNVADSHKFTIPTTEDGEFVSPAFAASDEVRICVSIGKHEWWRTEFIVLNGKITYRGNGGEQERVKVNEGQKAYLNFTNGTGSFK